MLISKVQMHLHKQVKFIYSEKATKNDEIFTVDLTLTTYCQIDGEEIVNFCGLIRKYELYHLKYLKDFCPESLFEV